MQPQQTHSGDGLLAEILAAKRVEVGARRAAVPESELAREAARHQPRGFTAALARPGRAVIAEMKAASPSRGPMRGDYRPAEIARGYEAAGARALSVLTDAPYFHGSREHLREARAAVRLPVLRKDFIIDPYQVTESAAAGADAVLLIVAALDDGLLRRLYAQISDYGMDALVEVHCEEEAGPGRGVGRPADRRQQSQPLDLARGSGNVSALAPALAGGLPLRQRERPAHLSRSRPVGGRRIQGLSDWRTLHDRRRPGRRPTRTSAG